MATVRPNLFQFIAYAYTPSRRPDGMRDWVAHDLAGKGAVRRFMLRAAIPPLLVLAPFWLLPVSGGNSIYVHSEMTVAISVWAYPRLVDTRSGGLCRLSESFFEVDRAHHTQG